MHCAAELGADTGVRCREAIARCADAARIRKPYKRKPSKLVKRWGPPHPAKHSTTHPAHGARGPSFLADTPYVKLMKLKVRRSPGRGPGRGA